MVKRPRQEISGAQKHQICLLAQQNTSLTQRRLVHLVEDRLLIKIDRSTISRVIAQQDMWLAPNSRVSKRQRRRKPHWEEMEASLVQRILEVQLLSRSLGMLQKICRDGLLKSVYTTVLYARILMGLCMAVQLGGEGFFFNDSTLMEYAKQFAEAKGISDFAGSKGWLHKFKERGGIKAYRMHGESRDADMSGVALAQGVLPTFIFQARFRLEDVFNFDETGLLYRTGASRALWTGPIKGSKHPKDRITLGLCVNALGTEKLLPLIIGKAAKPRCFGKSWNVRELCYYYHNAKAWMNASIFQDWLAKLDGSMKLQGRQVLLLVDNASPHKAVPTEIHDVMGFKMMRLAHVTVVFLPANTTSVVQPLDAGVIAAFKLHFKRMMMKWLLHQHEEGRGGPRLKPDVKDAIQWSAAVWKDLDPATVRHCWRKADILPPILKSELEAEDESYSRRDNISAQLAEILARLTVADEP